MDLEMELEEMKLEEKEEMNGANNGMLKMGNVGCQIPEQV